MEVKHERLSWKFEGYRERRKYRKRNREKKGKKV
jgi:hypothetical protein